jgi:hypothetical protein
MPAITKPAQATELTICHGSVGSRSFNTHAPPRTAAIGSATTAVASEPEK